MIPVIIPFYKAPDHLKRAMDCVNSSVGFTASRDFLHFVRNNNEDNILYTAAVNEGLMAHGFSGHEFVLILTQDCFVHPLCIDHLVRTMREYPDCGIVAPVQLDQNGETTFAGGTSVWPRGHHIINKISELPPKAYETHWANGACFLLRTECLKECGLLDQSMKFICSDADYSFTVRARGWKVMVNPSALAEHYCKSSSGTENKWLNSVMARDCMHFTMKWICPGLYSHLAEDAATLSPQKIQQHLAEWEAIIKDYEETPSK